MFAAGLFILSNLLFSAAATVVIFMPLGLALGLQSSHLVAFYLAANSVFFLPTLWNLAGRSLLRSDRDDENWKVLA